MVTISEEVEILLQSWAQYYIRFAYGTQGYPRIANFTRFYENGQIILRGAAGGIRVEENQEAELINRLYLELNQLKKPLAEALKAWYFREGFYQSREKVAAMLRLPRQTFDDRLIAAKKWIELRYDQEKSKQVA